MTPEQKAWLGDHYRPQADPVATLPVTYREALEGLRDIVFLAGQKHHLQHERADRQGAHPDIVGGFRPTRMGEYGMGYVECRGFEPVFRRRMAALGVPMFAHCIVRTPLEQERLKAEGFSKAGPGDSAHQYGCAVDFIHGTRAWDLAPIQWEVIGHVGKEVALSLGLKVEWGGDWKFYDPAHWELKGWRDVRATIRTHGEAMTVAEALVQMAFERSQT